MFEQLNPNTVLLVILAIVNCVTMVLGYFLKQDMRTLEINTNHKMDALLIKTTEAAEAKGRDDQRTVGEKTAIDLLEKGRLDRKEP